MFRFAGWLIIVAIIEHKVLIQGVPGSILRASPG